MTGDRMEFLGRNCGPAEPAVMTRTQLSGRVGGGLDPCAAMQTVIDLAQGQETEIVFIIGSGKDLNETRDLVGRFRGVDRRSGAGSGLGLLEPDAGKRAGGNAGGDAELSWPTDGCSIRRWPAGLWARSGFYQSGGAFGFRDQLQDAWRWCMPSRGLLRTTCCDAQGGNFARATCSTGGTRRRGAACGRGYRMIICGCPTRRADTWRRPGTPECSMRRCVFWRGGRSSWKRIAITISRGGRKSRRRYTSIACGRSSMA